MRYKIPPVRDHMGKKTVFKLELYVRSSNLSHSMKLILLIAIAVLVLTSCKRSGLPTLSTSESVNGLVSTSEIDVPTRTNTPQSLSPTSTSPPTQIVATVTPTPLSIQELDSGQYLVISRILPSYGANLMHDISLFVINVAGEEIGILSMVQGEVSLSPDQTTIAYWFGGDVLTAERDIRLRNLVDQHERNIEIGVREGSKITWSPDIDLLAFTDDQSISVLDLTNQELVQVLDCPKSIDRAAYCVVLGWSPVGKWLAHRVDIARSGSIDPKQLTYLLDTYCFSDVSTCASLDYAIMPFRTFGSWRPDGQYFAGAGTDGDVYIFDVTSWEVDQILPTGLSIESIQWSPDGQWLGFSSPRGIGLISPETGDWKFIWEASLKEDVTLAFWLSVGE